MSLSPYRFSQYICENAKNFIINNYIITTIIFICGVFAYGYELTHGTITLDEEIFWDKSTEALKWQCGLGRWSFYIYNKILFPNLYFPFTSCIFSLLLLSIAYAIYINNNNNPLSSKIIFGALSISFPTLGHMLSFSFMSAQVSFSYAIIVFSYLMIIRSNSKINFIIATVLAEFSIMTYQSLIFVPIGLFIIDNYNSLCSTKSIKIFLNIIIFLLSLVIIYLVLDKFIRYILDYQYPTYLLQQIKWIDINIDISKIIDDLYIYIESIFTKNNQTYFTFVFLFIPSIIIILKIKNKIYSLFLIAILFLYTISIFIIFGQAMPARSCLYIPILYAGFFYIAYNLSSYIGKITISILSIYIFCISCSINTNNSFLDTLARNKDMIIVSRIINLIYDSYPNYMSEAKYILFFGTHKSAKELGKSYGSEFKLITNYKENELFGQSYFEINSNENGRVRQYLQIMGIDMPWLDSQQKKSLISKTKEFADMPYYPEKGCVKIIDETLVIKLSP